MIDHNTPEEEFVTQFNQLAKMVSSLAETGSDNSAQLFSVLRWLGYIEAYLKKRDPTYTAFDAKKDEAACFVKMLHQGEISLDDLDTDKKTIQ